MCPVQIQGTQRHLSLVSGCFVSTPFSSKCSKFTGLLWLRYTHSHTCSPQEKKSWETERQNLLSTSTNSSTSVCLGCTERKRAMQADRHTERGYLLLKKARNLWIGVWICMRERELCLPVEWRRGSGASFCLPDLQMALWTQVSNGDVKECQWDSPFSCSLV